MGMFFRDVRCGTTNESHTKIAKIQCYAKGLVTY